MSVEKKSDANYENPFLENNKVWIPKRSLNKYVVDGILGQGSFGIVYSYRHPTNGKSVAIKIPNEGEMETARDELKFLSKIKSFKDGNKYLIKLLSSFMDEGRLCIVLEKMEMSLDAYFYEVIYPEYLGFTKIRRILYGVLMGLAKLKQLGIMHTDIKPKNIMLSNCGKRPAALIAKIIDFGLAHFTNQQDGDLDLQSQAYRSPEAIMHCLPYSEAVDVWSVGCILGELLLGHKMYTGRCEYDQLRYIIETQGLPPNKMIEEGLHSHLFFIEINEMEYEMKSEQDYLSTIRDKGGHDGEQYITDSKVIYAGRRQPYEFTAIADGMNKMSGDDRDVMASRKRQDVVNLLEAMLHLDPHQRISAEDAVKHSFFQIRPNKKLDRSQPVIKGQKLFQNYT